MPKTILIADDDPHIREVIRFALEKAGMQPVLAADGREALQCFAAQTPDLLVLDIGMPEMDGLELCRVIRKSSDVPILFLSAREEEVDRVVGLEIGGDDYVTKPFSPRELVARIQAILKRSARSSKPDTAPRGKGGLTLDADSHTARWMGVPVELTATEFDLLATLLAHPGKVFTRDELMDRAYGQVVVSDRTIDSHIRHIRQKFIRAGGEDVIATVHGVGYRLGGCRA